MSFTDGIPLNGQSLGDSRDLVRNNFSTLRTAMQVNHLNINGANSGKHDFVQMVNRTTPTILANESALYSRAIGGVTQLCLTGDANAEQYVMTRMDTANYATFGLDTDGWTFLPGRLLFQYGFVSSPGT